MDIQKLDQTYIAGTYARFPVTIVKGKGSLVWDENGKEYIRYIERTMALETEFENYLNDVRGLKTGHLSIGSNNVFASLVLPQVISNFNRLYPGVEVRLTEGNIFYLEERLAQGDLDLLLDNHPMDPQIYQQELFCAEQLLLAVSPSQAPHPVWLPSG